MYLWLEAFLLATGITARLIIPASTCGSGVNLLVVIFIWLALLVHLLDKSKLSAPAPTLPSLLKLLLGLFAAFIVVSFTNAPYKFGAFLYLVAWLSDIVLFYLVYSLCARDAKYITMLLSVFLATGLMVVGYGLYQHGWELRGLAEQVQQNPSLLSAIPAELQGATIARAVAGEPFATFLYQNSFGAFLALIIPLLIALAVIRQTRWWIGLIIGLVSLFVMVKTGSKGSMVALISGVIFGVFAFYWYRFSKLWRICIITLGSIIILFVLLIVIVLISDVPSCHCGDGIIPIPESLFVRVEYWDATVKIIRDNPITGVGLNQFSNSYLYYKTAQAGEVLKAHNDYLQMASEMGIPALLVFLAIWFIILKSIGRPARALVPESQIPYPASCILYPLILGAGFAFCLSEIFQTPLIALDIPFFSTIIVFVIWLLAFRFISAYLTTNRLNTNILRIGLFAGLLAFLIHCTVDFNFYVQGLSMSVWFIGAIFLSTAEPSTSLAFLKKQESKIMAVCVALVVIALCFVSVRLMKYESFLEQGKMMIKSNVREERLTGVDYLSKSFVANILSVDVSVELAWAMHKVYSWSEVEVNKYNFTTLPLCLERIAFAISLNPLAPMLYNQQGRLCLEHAEQERKAGHDKIARIYEQRAKRAFQMVKELYPTWRQQD